MTDVGRSLAVGLLVGALALGAAGGIAVNVGVGAEGPGGVTGADVRSPGESDERAAAVPADGVGENETVPHRNPDELTEGGDAAALETLFSEELADRLVESASAMGDGEYERARELLGEDYRNRLAQHGELSGERSVQLYEDASETQLELIDSAESYQEVRAEYERALEEGDEERARELARDLEANATDASERGDELRELYAELEEGTGEDYSEIEAAAALAEQELEAAQEEIREEHFVETELTLETDDERISFLEPLTAEAELRTADGEPVASEEITLQTGNATGTFQTDDDGAFDFEYPPTEESLSADELTFEYVPDDDSSHLGTEASVNVSIEQVEPTIVDLDAPGEVSYGEGVTVEGDLAVEDVPVDGVSLAVVIGEVPIGDVEVSDGSFEESLEVPAAVPDGERELRVELPFEDRALAATSVASPVTVLETETDLSVDATRVDDDVVLEGAFRTADGEPISNETVQVGFGELTEPVALDADGEFNETVSPPPDETGDVRATVAYSGDGTNLASAEAEAVVSGDESGAASPIWSLPTWGLFLVGLLVVAAVAGTVHRYRADSPTPKRVTEFDASRTESDRPSTDPDVSSALLSRAADAHSSGQPEAAIQACYVAVRHELSRRIDADDGLTHWEFYRRWRRDGSDDLDALLFELTEAYERAAFDARDVSSEAVEGVLERSRRVLEFDRTPADESDL